MIREEFIAVKLGDTVEVLGNSKRKGERAVVIKLPDARYYHGGYVTVRFDDGKEKSMSRWTIGIPGKIKKQKLVKMKVWVDEGFKDYNVLERISAIIVAETAERAAEILNSELLKSDTNACLSQKPNDMREIDITKENVIILEYQSI